MADVLGDEDEHDGNEEAQQGGVEGGGVEFGEPEPSGAGDRAEIHFAAHARDDVSEEDAEQDRQAADDPLEADREQEDRNDRGKSR